MSILLSIIDSGMPDHQAILALAELVSDLQTEVSDLRKTVDTLQAQHGNLAYMLRKAFIVEEAQS